MGFFSKLLGLDAGKATMKAANANKAEITAFGERGKEYIDTGEAKSAGFLGDAAALYDPYAATGGAANAMEANALGLNGAEGNAAAVAAFQKGPGYDFAVDESMRGAERAASAGGMLASGNLMAELQTRGQNLANQEYGNWLGRLSNTAGRGMTAAAGKGGTLTNLAELYQNTSGQRLGLDSSVVAGRMGATNQHAQGKEANANAWGALGGKVVDLGAKFAFGM